MSSHTYTRSPLGRTDAATTACLARVGKLCRCTTCTSSFVSTVSDVSTTCPPSEIGDITQDFETMGPARLPPLQAFSSNSTLAESIYDYQNKKASAKEPVSPNVRHRSPSRNEPNLPVARARAVRRSLGRSNPTPTPTPGRTASPRKAKPLTPRKATTLTPRKEAPFIPGPGPRKGTLIRRKNSDLSTTAVDDYEYEEAADFLPPLQVLPGRSIRAQALAPTHSDYNITPTPAIPLGRPANRRRFENAQPSSRF